MGVGKSTLGRELASKRRIPFFDLDEAIEKLCKKTIKEIIKSEGVGAFRDYESQLLGDLLLKRKPSILSLGGGCLLRPSNQVLVKERSTLVYLKVAIDELIKRMQKTLSSDRVFLSLPLKNHEVKALFSYREKGYQLADMSLNITGDTFQTALEKLIGLTQSFPPEYGVSLGQ